MTDPHGSLGRPVVDGLFREAAGAIRLIGSRCTGCGTEYFPALHACRNPDCLIGVLEQCDLPGRGTLYSFTWQSYRPPPLFVVDEWQPYPIGMVELTPNLMVMSRLFVAREELQIGMPLELAGDMLTAGVQGYVFRPVGDM